MARFVINVVSLSLGVVCAAIVAASLLYPSPAYAFGPEYPHW